MPMTVITLTKVPFALRGDLTKWMQEIATGVYVGNFNSKIRQRLWERVIKNVGKGQATISYSHRNELGYGFDTYQTYRQPINYEGIPLIRIPKFYGNETLKDGFSKAAKFTKIKKFNKSNYIDTSYLPTYVVLDIETTGLYPNKDHIIEIGAVKVSRNRVVDTFNFLINNNVKVPSNVQKLTGITDYLLYKKGKSLKEVLLSLKSFLNNYVIIGYNINFDMNFINHNMDEPLINDIIDVKKLVKKENMFMSNYHLETVLSSYDIKQNNPHRALSDAQVTKLLATKVNKFGQALKRKS